MQPQTPLIKQYFQAKAQHPGVLMAMRVGDFYELYAEDATRAAELLSITLTGKEDGKNGRIPMAGVPHHAIEKYIRQLLQLGEKVALCEQTEDPKKAKKLVRREVTRVMTPGTIVEDGLLEDSDSRFLAAICVKDGRAGLAALDPSTGEFLVTEFEGEALGERILQELARLRPAELIHDEEGSSLSETAKEGLGVAPALIEAKDARRAEEALLRQLDVESLRGYGVEEKPGAQIAASMVLDYATQNGLSLDHVESLATYSIGDYMTIDPATRRALELTRNSHDGSRRLTLLETLDRTATPMGRRRLSQWIDQPLLNRESIEARHAAVERLKESSFQRQDIRDALKRIGDIERAISRLTQEHVTHNPRDAVALRDALLAIPDLDEALRPLALERLHELRQEIGDHHALAHELRQAIRDECPPNLQKGGIFREGYDPELDSLRSAQREGREYIAAVEAKEREATGIEKLKVGYNSVFGYYLEAPKSQIAKVPPEYIRKQTLANAERYITDELKRHESAVLGAEEKALALEADLFHKVRRRIMGESAALQQTARAISQLDVLTSFAEAALDGGFVKPDLTDENSLDYQAGRHPVVERGGAFVPNDLELNEGRKLMILTGPNMSGKSTYLRQTALIVLMAQIGSFVPATSANLGLCDRIFTRIGARDELALGQSTFMVEMIESANILNNASDRSLVILDEVGRGTSTFDGLAIAWAMAEHLAHLGAKTLFATHYHQLNTLSDYVPTVFNCRVDVREDGDEVIWTHRVLPGGADRSYGIQVARMAGLPKTVVGRAQDVLDALESEDQAPIEVPAERMQMTLFEAEEPAAMKELRSLDVDRLTPMDALIKLQEWREKLS